MNSKKLVCTSNQEQRREHGFDWSEFQVITCNNMTSFLRVQFLFSEDASKWGVSHIHWKPRGATELKLKNRLIPIIMRQPRHQIFWSTGQEYRLPNQEVLHDEMDIYLAFSHNFFPSISKKKKNRKQYINYAISTHSITFLMQQSLQTFTR